MAKTLPEIRIAHHEAGHVVASILLRQAFKQATIDADGYGSLGHVPFRTRTRSGLKIDSSDRVRNRIEREVTINLAGIAAEQIRTNNHRYLGTSDDADLAIALARHRIGDEEEASAYVKWLLVRTRNSLNTRRSAPPSAERFTKQRSVPNRNSRDVKKQSSRSR